MAFSDRYTSELSGQLQELATSTLKTVTDAGLFQYGLACGKVQGLQLALDSYMNFRRDRCLEDDKL